MQEEIIKARFKNKLYEQMFRIQKKDADYAIAKVFIDKIDDLLEINIEEIAFLAHTSAAAVTKFCKKLGYSGFSQIKQPTLEADIIFGHFQNIPNSSWTSGGVDTFCLETCRMTYFYEKCLNKEDIFEIARILSSSKKTMILTGLHGFSASNLFAELTMNQDLFVYEIDRNSEDTFIESLAKECEVLFLISLSERWIKERKKLFEKLRSKMVWITLDETNYEMFKKIQLPKSMDSMHSVYFTSLAYQVFFILLSNEMIRLKNQNTDKT